MYKTKKNTLITYVILVIIITLISLALLLYGVWEFSVCFGISAFVNFFHLVTCLYFQADSPRSGEVRGSNIVLLNGTRFLLLVISIVVPALIVYFVPNSSEVLQVNKLRYLYILSSAGPIFISLIWFYLWSRNQ